MTWVNVGCGPYRAPEPWVNLDAHRGHGVEPDVLVDDPMRPLDFVVADEGIDRVYLGHVLEHIPWPEVPIFLQHIYDNVLPGAVVMVVGPDVLRIIKRWHEGLDPEGFLLVESCLENPWDRCYGEEGYGVMPASPETGWEEKEPRWKHSRHWWNCYENRVLYALHAYTKFEGITPHPIDTANLGIWPLVAYTQWQCAVSATKPTT